MKLEKYTIYNILIKYRYLHIVLFIMFVFSLLFTNIKTIKNYSVHFLNGLGIYTEEVKNVEITSNDYNEPGSWHIDKHAEWVDTDKAKITFDVNTVLKSGQRKKDIILVMDTSESMLFNGKMDKAKEDSIDLIDRIMDDVNNRIALIRFSTNAEILSSFTNDAVFLRNKIEDMYSDGDTNYNDALLKVTSILEGYTQESGKDLIMLFVTDGFPSIAISKHVGTYQLLKSAYPYLKAYGIQYEMGAAVIEDIKKISDRQFVAKKENLRNILFDATFDPDLYDYFTIEDYLDNNYFENVTVDKVEVNTGTVSVDGNKITWDLIDNSEFKTGMQGSMRIIAKLKDEYINTDGLYPTNIKEKIVSKANGGNENSIESNLTPILKNYFEVKYEVNAPSTCSLPGYQNEKYYVYQNVTKKTIDLFCEGYLFKGWKIDSADDRDIIHINDDMFKMPTHDVTIRGTWTKQAITKTMDGTVKQKATLYKVFQDYNGTFSVEYTDEHQDSMAGAGDKKIYTWTTDTTKDISNKNNVIFGDKCWEMYRTTDTGGVKLIYNGEAEDDKCLDTRGTHNGMKYGLSRFSFSSEYYYGTDFVYDEGTKKFRLSGTKFRETWSISTAESLNGKYTCMLNTENGSCSTLYYINGIDSDDYPFYISYTANNTPFYSVGSSAYNDIPYYSIAGAGYMYNKYYIYNTKNAKIEYMLNKTQISQTLRYSDTYSYDDETHYYKFNDSDAHSPDELNNSEELVGKYIFTSPSHNTSDHYYYTSFMGYVVSATDGEIRYVVLCDGASLESADYTYTFGSSYSPNPDGTYTIDDPINISKRDWFTYKNNMKNKFVCKNAVDNKCEDVWFIYYMSDSTFMYNSIQDNYIYSNGFIYENGSYKLDSDRINTWYFGDTRLKNHHYTCFDLTGECEELNFVTSTSNNGLQYITLKNGESVTDAITNMSSALDINKNDSAAKMVVDKWYEQNLIEYADYTEDVIFCNNRKVQDLGSYNPNTGDPTKYMSFRFDNYKLNCGQETDMFSVSNPKAKLKYKVGLISSEEARYARLKISDSESTKFWTITPSSYGGGASIYCSSSSGCGTTMNLPIRPVISLIPDIEYISGDGSMDDPFKIDTTGNN